DRHPAAHRTGSAAGSGTRRSGPARRPDSPVDERYTFDRFVLGAGNRFAGAAAMSVAEIPGRNYNPLFIHGGSGLGKTHLLHAIVHYQRHYLSHLTVRYVTAETFLNHFIQGIQTNTQSAFKSRYRDVDVLLLDDIQIMEGKEGLQDEVFHTFNDLHNSNRQIVISSDRPPRNIPTLSDRLRSRFEWGLITDVKPPDFETRMAILRLKTGDADIPDGVLEFIAEQIDNNIRELEGALTRVTALARLTHSEVTLDLARETLGDMAAREARKITPTRILDLTVDRLGYSAGELCGPNRQKGLVEARHTCMYVIRELTDLSYPAIADMFGGRDHTSAMHAVRKIASKMQDDRPLFDRVTDLISAVKAA
ncbi:MAG TPA: chromosomal replication initiator protein DnaA, partial [Acidimicrobiaceae bacterium]|nr:chromosomal replication initiator protein DnaA [Acidimicrobiaceae bacterium]